ncbi:DUF883 family protein [Pyrinomonas methylaliphatogenes]|jgi:ElaB/YqjD/DUF883 family membrane-anchored ribosome-binding protein|uniref:DUF883 domain-containing protein n=1 Tax=Pyrinomonas methylaliphatogenes TaxID=454194 RepID=A0A0B6WZG0_9BACT|nr:DUF883 family protein [Pyrinomonas methylaliphatogenes]CDM65689.1 hypothetical protein PYK22_01694 [Pyrinomonas methylaliphatogenes]
MEEMRANVEYGSTGSEEPQAQDLARQAREQVQQIGQKVATAATQAKDYVSEKAAVVGSKIKDLQSKDIREVADEAKSYARQNPGQALLISAAAGFLLGLLFRRR